MFGVRRRDAQGGRGRHPDSLLHLRPFRGGQVCPRRHSLPSLREYDAKLHAVTADRARPGRPGSTSARRIIDLRARRSSRSPSDLQMRDRRSGLLESLDDLLAMTPMGNPTLDVITAIERSTITLKCSLNAAPSAAVRLATLFGSASAHEPD